MAEILLQKACCVDGDAQRQISAGRYKRLAVDPCCAGTIEFDGSANFIIILGSFGSDLRNRMNYRPMRSISGEPRRLERLCGCRTGKLMKVTHTRILWPPFSTAFMALKRAI